jgi:hypothetical protein
MSKIAIVTVVILCGFIVPPFVIGFGDILGGLIDNQLGLVTGTPFALSKLCRMEKAR